MPVEFVFDQTKCTGCQACVLACTIENQLAFDQSWRTVYTFNGRHYPGVAVRHLSLACNHCEDPACLAACPANAYSRDATTGIVTLDQRSCIGCRYCTWACPYGAPKFDEASQVVGKCTFCAERQSAGKRPACVELCPTGALALAERSDRTTGGTAVGFPRTDLGPAISFSATDRGRLAPDCSSPRPLRQFVPANQGKSMVVALSEEWPLAAFTFIVPLLVALIMESVVGGSRPAAALYVALAALAGVLSLGHLGKKSRAWRAVSNPITSWLSREVLLFGILGVLGTVLLGLAPTGWYWGALTIAVGFATLLSIDQVYASLPLVNRRAAHSASVVLTAILLSAVLLSSPTTAGLVGVVKLFLYVRRKYSMMGENKTVRPALSALRVVSGFLLPAILWLWLRESAVYFVMSSILLGELIDRLEFYAELDITSPTRQMAIDLQTAVSATKRVSVS